MVRKVELADGLCACDKAHMRQTVVFDVLHVRCRMRH